MPRNGDGSSDNGPIEADSNIIHGAGNVEVFSSYIGGVNIIY
jgi:hypothetical protein